jgi:hypothetical protein
MHASTVVSSTVAEICAASLSTTTTTTTTCKPKAE